MKQKEQSWEKEFDEKWLAIDLIGNDDKAFIQKRDEVKSFITQLLEQEWKRMDKDCTFDPGHVMGRKDGYVNERIRIKKMVEEMKDKYIIPEENSREIFSNRRQIAHNKGYFDALNDLVKKIDEL